MFLRQIESMGQFAPQLVLLDTHCQGDAENGYTFQTKPNISVYHRSLGDNVPTGCDSSLIDMHVEFKLYDWDDPFICPPRDCHDTTFISTKPNETNTLGLMQQHSSPCNFVRIVSPCTSSMMLPASFSGKGMERSLRSPSTITLTQLSSDSSLNFHRLPLNYAASIPQSLRPRA